MFSKSAIFRQDLVLRRKKNYSSHSEEKGQTLSCYRSSWAEAEIPQSVRSEPGGVSKSSAHLKTDILTEPFTHE